MEARAGEGDVIAGRVVGLVCGEAGGADRLRQRDTTEQEQDPATVKWVKWAPLTPSNGERIPRKNSRFEPPNLRSAGVFSLSSSGGEGWGEEAVSSTPRDRFVGREERASLAAVRQQAGTIAI